MSIRDVTVIASRGIQVLAFLEESLDKRSRKKKKRHAGKKATRKETR